MSEWAVARILGVNDTYINKSIPTFFHLKFKIHSLNH